MMEGVVVYDDSVCKALVNNKLHWRAAFEKGGRRFEFIAAFDMVRRLYRKIHIPLQHEGMKHCTLSELKGSLSMFVYCRYQANRRTLEMWVMDEHGVAESWRKEITIGPHYHEIGRVVVLVSIVSSEIMWYQKAYKLAGFNVKTQELKACQHLSMQLTLKVENYKEGLVKLQGETLANAGCCSGEECYPSTASFAFLFCLFGYLNSSLLSNQHLVNVMTS